MRLRRLVASLMGAAVLAPLSIESGYLADLLSDRRRVNAVLMLRSFGEGRLPAARLMAERLGCATWSLYFVGCKVLIGRDGATVRLLDERGSVLGELREVSDAAGAFECAGPGLEGPHYVLLRK